MFTPAILTTDLFIPVIIMSDNTTPTLLYLNATYDTSTTATNTAKMWTSEFDVVHASLLIVFGLAVNLCNLLVIVTVLNFRALSNSDVLILALSAVDYFASWVLFPIAIVVYLSDDDLSANPGVVCDIFTTVSTCAQLLSTAIITLMTLDRFLAIRRPIFYKTKLTVGNVKVALVLLVVTCALLSCIPMILQALDLTAKFPRGNDTRTTCFNYPVPNAYIILAWSYPQIPIVVYSYFGFIVYIRQFVKHKSQSSFNSGGSSKKSILFECRKFLCCHHVRCSNEDDSDDEPTRQEVLEKTLAMMKALNLKRCTRMANTVVWIVLIYYVAWSFVLVSMVKNGKTKNQKHLYQKGKFAVTTERNVVGNVNEMGGTFWMI